MNILDTINSICEADEETLRDMSLNSIADFYRSGGDLRTLTPLLTSSRVSVVRCGAWIASEVADRDRGHEIFEKLAILLYHADEDVRFLAIEGVALLVTPEQKPVIGRLIEMMADRSRMVRLKALQWICWISNSTIEALMDTDFREIAYLLVNCVDKREILSAVRSGDCLVKRTGIAAAIRNFGMDRDYIEDLACQLDDEEEVTDILNLLRYLAVVGKVQR